MQPYLFIKALFKKYYYTNILFIILIAFSVALSVAVTSQERSIRQSSAQVANKMPVTVTALGSPIDMLLMTSYLQMPTYAPEMLPKEKFIEILNEPDAVFVAPLGFGDNYAGYAIVGTTAELADYLSCIGNESVNHCLNIENNLSVGSNFTAMGQAVIGADVALNLGAVITPIHGTEETDTAEEVYTAHGAFPIRIVGRMKPSGTPWDRAILVPIEQVWRTHGLPNGHDINQQSALGTPFDEKYLASVPAVFVASSQPFAIRNKYNSGESMALSAGSVLPRLYSIMGDIRNLLSVLTLLTQIMVSAAIVSGILVLLRLFQRNIGILRALGAPQKYIFTTLWGYTFTLMCIGSISGLILGYTIATVLSRYIAQQTGIAMVTQIGVNEIILVLIFLVIASLVAFIPALILMKKNPVTILRS